MSVRGVLPSLRPSEVAQDATPACFYPVRWGGKNVRLISRDGGETYLGGTGEEGLLLVVRRGIHPVTKKEQWVARIEDRDMRQSWPGEARPRIDIAVASLHRECKRLSRAAALRTS